MHPAVPECLLQQNESGSYYYNGTIIYVSLIFMYTRIHLLYTHASNLLMVSYDTNDQLLLTI